MDPQTQSFFYIIIIDIVLLLLFAVVALLIIQCRRKARSLSNLTAQNLLLMHGSKGMLDYINITCVNSWIIYRRKV